jgi:N-acetyl-anhydromuramyl-L-alanine amidase AmpD
MIIQDLVSQLPTNPKKKPKTRKLSSIKKLILHTTDWDIAPLELAKYDIGPNHIDSTGCPSITYHYLIGKDGTVFRTAPEETITWHAGGYNTESIAVSLIYKTDPAFESGKGKFNPDKVPTEAMMESLVELLVELCKKFKVDPLQIFGHRELFGTGFVLLKGHKALRKTCPGMAVDLDEVRENVVLELQEQMKARNIYRDLIDGDWGKKSQAAFKEFTEHLT